MYRGKPPDGDRPLKTLERVLSKAGLGSRTEARRWIGAGRVAVNGTAIQDPDAWIDLERDQVTFDGTPLASEARSYLLLHKPEGYLCTYRDPAGRPTVYDLLPDRDRYLFPVGRLDYDTSGLLIMTNDSALAEQLTNPAFHVAKTYDVTASIPLTDPQLDRLRAGIPLEDGITRPARVDRRNSPSEPAHLCIIITEGRNRQVRRMIESLGAHVDRLVRTGIGSITLDELQSGAFRPLSSDEIASLATRSSS